MNPLVIVLVISLFNVHLDASANAEKSRYPPCNLKEEYLDTNEEPPMCRPCSPCPKDENEITPCTGTKDRVCSFCPIGEVWSDLESFCRPCGCCNGKHQVQIVCLASGFLVNEACIADGPCPTKASNSSSPASSVTPATSMALSAAENDTTKILVGVGVGVIVIVGIIFAAVAPYMCKRIRTKKANQQPLPAPRKDEEAPLSVAETTGDRAAYSGDDTTLKEEEPDSVLNVDHTTEWNNVGNVPS